MIGSIIVYIGISICLIGLICFFICRDFSARLLLTSIIDSCGFFTVALGLVLRLGLSFDSLRVLGVLIIFMVIGPVTTHEIARLFRKDGLGSAEKDKETEEVGS